jgi:hypothetical protein
MASFQTNRAHSVALVPRDAVWETGFPILGYKEERSPKIETVAYAAVYAP